MCGCVAHVEDELRPGSPAPTLSVLQPVRPPHHRQSGWDGGFVSVYIFLHFLIEDLKSLSGQGGLS